MTEAPSASPGIAVPSVLRLAVDHDFNQKILDGIARRVPGLDAIRVSAVGLAAATDRDVLAWAADDNRIVISHDARP